MVVRGKELVNFMIPNVTLRAKATKDCDVGKLCRSSAGYAPPEQGAFESMTSGWDWSSCKSAVSEPDHR